MRRFALPFALDGPVVLTAGTALAIGLSAFVAQGGAELDRTTWTEVGLLLAGAVISAIALLTPRRAGVPRRVRGGCMLAGFALLAVYTTLSITWSLTPSDSWLEADRTFAYLAVLAAGVALGRLAPARWTSLIHAVALSALAICGWSLLTKVFPGWLAPDESFARLRPPFGYWNSVGLAAALGVPPLLWLAARRSGHAAVNALAWPALGAMVVCILLSYSRGALLAVGIGLAVWLAIVPLRLRSIVVIAGVLAATLPLVAWAFAQDGLALDGAQLALREDSGYSLGALLLLLFVALTTAGLAVGFLGDRHPPDAQVRARASRLLVGALAVVPAVAVLMLSNAPGGISGQISKAWTQATNPVAETPANTPSRFSQTSSVRARYWREALKLHADSPWLGNGAGSYGTLRLRYRTEPSTARHAHGYVVQTLADLGWVGLGISLLPTLAWFWAAARALGLRRRDRGLHWDAERVGLAALALVALIFGLHSAIDWTWFVPGNVVPALLCAGWVASRGTIRERLEPVADVVPRRGLFAPAAGALAVAGAVLLSWAALQPVRSEHAETAAFDRVDQGALVAAASIARIAHERDPLSKDPLFDLAAIEQARGDRAGAQRALDQAVDLEPATAETWRRLGHFRLEVLNDPKSALRAFQAAYYLDPMSARSVSDIVTTSRLVPAG